MTPHAHLVRRPARPDPDRPSTRTAVDPDRRRPPDRPATGGQSPAGPPIGTPGGRTLSRYRVRIGIRRETWALVFEMRMTGRPFAGGGTRTTAA